MVIALEDILQLKRPTSNHEQWLEIVEAWLPVDASKIIDDLGRVAAFRVDRHFTGYMFSCHIDTVHTDVGYQQIDQSDGHYRSVNSNCLGADDGAGVWLMLEMIDAGVRGSYLFHCYEESGQQGAAYIGAEHGDWLDRFSWIIALDRPGVTDFVTEYCGEPLCFEPDADKLLSRLNKNLSEPYKLALNKKGGITDVLCYMGRGVNITNISTGYYQPHKPSESLDKNYLLCLRDCLVSTFLS